jgi:ubiquinone/menaquinone biosynthesis C-methylase UbiE
MALSPVATRKFSDLYETEGQKNVLDKETNEILVPILKELKYGIGETIMDHGCGTGRVGSIYFVPAAVRSHSKIYAVDNSKTMISHAKEFYPNPAVTYVLTDLLDPDSPMNSVKFNKIFSIHCLVVVKDWR